MLSFDDKSPFFASGLPHSARKPNGFDMAGTVQERVCVRRMIEWFNYCDCGRKPLDIGSI